MKINKNKNPEPEEKPIRALKIIYGYYVKCKGWNDQMKYLMNRGWSDGIFAAAWLETNFQIKNIENKTW